MGGQSRVPSISLPFENKNLWNVRWDFMVFTSSDGFSNIFSNVLPFKSRLIQRETQYKIKIANAKTIVKAPKITAKYKKSKTFKVTVNCKSSKNPLKA